MAELNYDSVTHVASNDARSVTGGLGKMGKYLTRTYA